MNLNLEVNAATLEAFWRAEREFLYICRTVGQQKKAIDFSKGLRVKEVLN